jgi:hypothetical protein
VGHRARGRAGDPIGESGPVSASWALRVLLTATLFEIEYLTRPITLQHNHISTVTQTDPGSFADQQPRQPSK